MMLQSKENEKRRGEETHRTRNTSSSSLCFESMRELKNCVFYAKEYHPIQAGSIDGTDTMPHDRAIQRAMHAYEKGTYTPYLYSNDDEENVYSTIFVSRFSFHVTEQDLKKEFEKFGKIKKIKLVRDIVTGLSKRYAFIEYEKERDMHYAFRNQHEVFFDDLNVLVDYNRSKLMKGFIPRRLGGGLGGKKESGQLRFGGRDKPFRAPMKDFPKEELNRLGISIPSIKEYFPRNKTPPLPLRENLQADETIKKKKKKRKKEKERMKWNEGNAHEEEDARASRSSPSLSSSPQPSFSSSLSMSLLYESRKRKLEEIMQAAPSSMSVFSCERRKGDESDGRREHVREQGGEGKGREGRKEREAEESGGERKGERKRGRDGDRQGEEEVKEFKGERERKRERGSGSNRREREKEKRRDERKEMKYHHDNDSDGDRHHKKKHHKKDDWNTEYQTKEKHNSNVMHEYERNDDFDRYDGNNGSSAGHTADDYFHPKLDDDDHRNHRSSQRHDNDDRDKAYHDSKRHQDDYLVDRYDGYDHERHEHYGSHSHYYYYDDDGAGTYEKDGIKYDKHKDSYHHHYDYSSKG